MRFIFYATKASLSLVFFVFFLSCTSTQFDLSNHTHAYRDGQLVLFTNQQDCFLSINGEINPPLEKLAAQSLGELVAKDCAQRVVLLQSHGGDIHAAMAIGQMIRSYGLTTHIYGYCDSACGFVFVGGVQRTVSLDTASERGSALGFHQPKPLWGLRHCLGESQINPLLLNSVKSYLRSMLPKEGADAYYQELMSSPCKGMDYLNAKLLLEKGIATSVEW